MSQGIRSQIEKPDVAVLGTLVAMIAILPICNLLVPDGSPFHVSTFTITLLGKYACYAMLALSVPRSRATISALRQSRTTA